MDTLMNETELKVSCQGPFQKFSIEAWNGAKTVGNE
jgi:hypothetical protein